MCLFVRRSEPRFPPTSSAAEAPLPFKTGFKQALKCRSFVVLMLCLGGGVGLFNAIYTLIQQVLCVSGYSNTFAGICGALLIAGGLVGATIAGVIVDKTKMFSEVIKICYAMAALAACAFAVLSQYEKKEVPIAVLCALFGGFGFAVYPIGLEVGVECTFPVAEATSSGLIVISGQVMGIVIVLVMQQALAIPLGNSPDWFVQTCSAAFGSSEPVTDWAIAILFWAALACLFAICTMIFFHPRYRRLAHEAGLRVGAAAATTVGSPLTSPPTSPRPLGGDTDRSARSSGSASPVPILTLPINAHPPVGSGGTRGVGGSRPARDGDRDRGRDEGRKGKGRHRGGGGGGHSRPPTYGTTDEVAPNLADLVGGAGELGNPNPGFSHMGDDPPPTRREQKPKGRSRDRPVTDTSDPGNFTTVIKL